MNAAEHISHNLIMPDPAYAGHWDAIVTEPDIKNRLISQVMLAFTVRGRISFERSALHGLITLVGPPGTGKTTLAQGLGYMVSTVAAGRKARFIEIAPHGLMSGEHGQTQQAVEELLLDHLPSLVEDGLPTIVLIDEVETMAVARSVASLDANPVDVHRATDAVLTALDQLTRTAPNVVFLVTSNFPETLDTAFLSRSDAVIDVPLPDQAALQLILEDTLNAFAEAFPAMAKLASNPSLRLVAQAAVGLDGRQARKLVARALALDIRTATKPETLTMEQLLKAAKKATAAAVPTPGDQEAPRVRAL